MFVLIHHGEQTVVGVLAALQFAEMGRRDWWVVASENKSLVSEFYSQLNCTDRSNSSPCEAANVDSLPDDEGAISSGG